MHKHNFRNEGMKTHSHIDIAFGEWMKTCLHIDITFEVKG